MVAKAAAGFVIFRRCCNEIQYLLLKASYGSRHWSPPKGHIDPGEDDFTTALRETKEEAGYSDDDLIIYKDKQIILNYDVMGESKNVKYWLAELKDANKEPKLSAEHTEFCWLNKDAAIVRLGFPNSQYLIEESHNYIEKTLS